MQIVSSISLQLLQVDGSGGSGRFGCKALGTRLVVVVLVAVLVH